MEYTIKPAGIEEKDIISKLLQPYLSELSQFDDIYHDPKNERSKYVYPYLNAYWVEEDRHPYLFYRKQKVAGFALVRRVEDYYEMAEFYILPEFRRRGLGTVCATDILHRHDGIWRIGFIKQNVASRALWKKLADKLAKGNIEEGQMDVSHNYMSFKV